MSWVALLKATSQKKARVLCTKCVVGMQKATPASPAPNRIWVMMIHHRLLRSRSITGLQKGLMTHGR